MSIASHAISPTLYARLPFDAEKDFTPVSMLWQVPNIFCGQARHPGEDDAGAGRAGEGEPRQDTPSPRAAPGTQPASSAARC